MAQPDTSIDERKTVIIVGGKGGLSARYREEIEKSGLECQYYEDRVPANYCPARHRILMVIIMVTMVSHPLMAKARALAGNEARVVYLKTPSLSSVRHTLAAATVPSQARAARRVA